MEHRWESVAEEQQVGKVLQSFSEGFLRRLSEKLAVQWLLSSVERGGAPSRGKGGSGDRGGCGGGGSAERLGPGRHPRGRSRRLDPDPRDRGGRGGELGERLGAAERRLPLRENRRRAVTDVQVLSDRSPQPPGYTRAPEFPEPRSRKKRLYVQMVPGDAATTAVCDIKLSSKSKVLPHPLKIG
ncbi:uncharacterized protein LRP34_009164 [Phaethornis superciliosus]